MIIKCFKCGTTEDVSRDTQIEFRRCNACWFKEFYPETLAK